MDNTVITLKSQQDVFIMLHSDISNSCILMADTELTNRRYTGKLQETLNQGVSDREREKLNKITKNVKTKIIKSKSPQITINSPIISYILKEKIKFKLQDHMGQRAS